MNWLIKSLLTIFKSPNYACPVCKSFSLVYEPEKKAIVCLQCDAIIKSSISGKETK